MLNPHFFIFFLKMVVLLDLELEPWIHTSSNFCWFVLVIYLGFFIDLVYISRGSIRLGICSVKICVFSFSCVLVMIKEVAKMVNPG